MRFLQEEKAGKKSIRRRINQLVEVQQIREGVYEKYHIFQGRMKIFLIKWLKNKTFKLEIGF